MGNKLENLQQTNFDSKFKIFEKKMFQIRTKILKIFHFDASFVNFKFIITDKYQFAIVFKVNH